MTSITDLYNMAIGAAGGKATIASTSENSREVKLANLWYPRVRHQVLQAAPWSCARAAFRLNLLATRDTDEDWVQSDPAPTWLYSYAWPSNCLRPRYLEGYHRFASGITANNERVLYANVENPILTYTRDQTNVELWDEDLVIAIAFGLAAFISFPLNGKQQLAAQLADRANSLILAARATDANVDNDALTSIPSWIAARGYSALSTEARYYYPFGPLLSVVPGALDAS